MGRLHPLASLQFELNVLPVKWEAMKRGIEFWVHVMRVGEGRLLKEVMREAMKLGRVKWVRDLRMGLDVFGWQGVDMQALSGLSMNEVKHILKCMAWRRAREGCSLDAYTLSHLVGQQKAIRSQRVLPTSS